MIVMKFGGSSIKDAEGIQRVINIIQRYQPSNPVVVVSAMGKTTRNLLLAGELASLGKTSEALKKLAEIETHHLSELTRLSDLSRESPIFSKIIGHFEEIRDLIKGLSILKDFSPRCRDAMAAFGELLSSAILSAGLVSQGVDAVLIDVRSLMITDDNFTCAAPLEEIAVERFRRTLLPELERRRMPVIQGYIGSTLQGATTTLGFEGSDFTAAFAGAALDVSDIQIWKDVPGLMSADPAVIKNARTIPVATFDEMAELTYFGAKLLHPRAIFPAARKRIPIHIFNSWQPQTEGTVIIEGLAAPQQGVRSIAFKRGLTLLQLISNQQQPLSEYMKGIFDVLDRHRITPDLAAISSIHLMLALSESLQVERALPEFRRFGSVELSAGKASICLVGQGLIQQAGIASRALASISGVRLDVISQGSSPNSLMVILDENQLDSALAQIHSRFFPG
jgi:aspartate kinase